MRRILPLLLAAGLISGCRTAGPQVCIRDSHGVTVTLTAETRASMGKSVSGEVSPEVSASVAAQASDNVVAQGDATKTGDTGDATISATATPTPTEAE